MLITVFGPAPLSRVVAEGLGIRSIAAYLVPSVPTAAFPPPGWPGPGDLGPALNLEAARNPAPPRPEHRRLGRDAGASANVSSGYEIMEQLAYATLVEDCERVVDEVGYAELRVRGLHG